MVGLNNVEFKLQIGPSSRDGIVVCRAMKSGPNKYIGKHCPINTGSKTVTCQGMTACDQAGNHGNETPSLELHLPDWLDMAPAVVNQFLTRFRRGKQQQLHHSRGKTRASKEELCGLRDDLQLSEHKCVQTTSRCPWLEHIRAGNLFHTSLYGCIASGGCK